MDREGSMGPWNRTLFEPPPIVNNVVLNPEKGWFSIVIPRARVNRVTNPSGETNTTNWSVNGGGSSLARSTEQQYHGAYSFKCTLDTSSAGDDDGLIYGASTGLSVTSGNVYAASIKFRAQTPGVKFKLAVGTSVSALLTSKTFKSTGRWQWIWVIYKESATATNREIFILRDGSTSGGVPSSRNAPFYVDGVQFEECETDHYYPTTYIDGDQQGLFLDQFPPPYGWNGARHASTSFRTANTRSGGRVRNLDDFKILLTGIEGLGVPPASHYATVRGLQDGATYQTSLVGPRSFTLDCQFNTSTPLDLEQQWRLFSEAVNLDLTAPRQPLVLLFQEYQRLEPVGDVGRLVVSLGKGGSGNRVNPINEGLNLPFQQWTPFITGEDQGTTLTQAESVTVTAAANLMYRDATGDWSRATTLAALETINDIALHPDGSYYIVGNFTSLGNHIVRYDPIAGTFSSLGTGLSSSALRVRISPDGRVFVGGGFATANGVTVNNVTYWNGTTFVALGSGGTKGVDNTVRGLAIDALGNCWVCGQFLNAGGAAAVRAAKWTSATDAWSALSTGLNSTGLAVEVGLDGLTVYFGGGFDVAGGVTVNGIGKWNGSAFSALQNGVSAFDVREIRVASDGSLFVGGAFTTASGLTVNLVARWTGSTWIGLGSGVTTGTVVSRMCIGSDGLLYIGGSFSAVNNISLSDAFAAWNGSSWILPDIDMAGSPQADAIGTGRRGELLVAFSAGTASNASAAQLNTLTNDGATITYPTFFITGPSSSTTRLYQVRSYTTGHIISFNLTIFANEEIKISFGPSQVIATSNIRGDVSQYILPGSSAELPLVKGSNSIAMLAIGGTITTLAIWPKRFVTFSDLIY